MRFLVFGQIEKSVKLYQLTFSFPISVDCTYELNLSHIRRFIPIALTGARLGHCYSIQDNNTHRVPSFAASGTKRM